MIPVARLLVDARAHGPCDPEVRDQGDSVGEQHVPGLDVPVDHPVLVSVFECARDLPRETQRGFDGEGLFAIQAHPQRLAFDVGHDVVELPVDLTRIVQWQDVRVCKPRGNLDLSQETLVPDRRGHLGVEGFYRDFAAVLQVVGQVDDGHAAAPKLAARSGNGRRAFFQRRCLVLMFADAIAKSRIASRARGMSHAGEVRNASADA